MGKASGLRLVKANMSEKSTECLEEDFCQRIAITPGIPDAGKPCGRSGDSARPKRKRLPPYGIPASAAEAIREGMAHNFQTGILSGAVVDPAGCRPIFRGRQSPTEVAAIPDQAKDPCYRAKSRRERGRNPESLHWLAPARWESPQARR